VPANPVRGIAQTAGNGSWGGTTPHNFAYQWISCNDAGADCSNIPGAQGQSYTPVGADLGRRLRIHIRATGPDGASATAESGLSDNVVAATPPVNQGRPTIEGTTVQGSSLSSSPGFWQGTPPITFAYQWSRCAGGTCAEIPGATGQSYTAAAADVGKQLKVRVTATNVADSGTAESALTAVITAKPVKAPKKKSKAKKLKPFPKVQIGGLVAPAGAFFNVFRVVNVPKGAKVTVKCRGRGCPFKSTRRVKVSKSRATVKSLLGRGIFNGARIQIRVTKKGFVGKYTGIRIRSNRAPARVDRCLQPGKTKPSKC
jgi:hypothetical protein